MGEDREIEPGRDLDRTRPVDVTGDPGVPEDTVPTLNGLAMEHYGKTYGDLKRYEQNMIRSVVEGNRRELEATVKSLRNNNMVSSEVLKGRAYETQRRLDKIHEHIIKDVEDFIEFGDDMDESLAEMKKTRSGTVRTKLRTMAAVERLEAARLRNRLFLAKLDQEEQVRQITLNQDNRQVTVAPQDVADRLGKFTKGEVVDQSGDGSGRDSGT